ncbi:acyl carrier protein [Streptomyces sp. NPDC012389]|uniref:acyl carrier protein n=1 Tax=unclassified Streptomyces TaxID=2593676 RepID=UPI00081D90A9|nr:MULTISPECIES: acyl carrier protein [unclassified Streptomyces]MYR96295.1 acyl carrier protein [Streptomyces sp. SID4937]SCE06992.1 act minimal PKS acyl carrier protein [Streptomyces sp. ScaeMP-e83]
MAEFGQAELEEIMRQSMGEDEPVDLSAQDTRTFEELGYDSLAVLEVVNRIARTYEVQLPEEELAEVKTPIGLLAFVKERLRAAA